MKLTSWKTAIACGLAFSLSTAGLLAEGFTADSKDGGKGKDKPHGGGEKSQAGKEGKQPGNAAGAQQSGQSHGGIHAPAVAAGSFHHLCQR